MGAGFDFALNEITLVFFTTLAPSGAVAFVLMGLSVYGRSGSASDRARSDAFMGIPLAAAMVGLVASATHLGNPDNALYVLAGVGRSPLSTEVVFAVAFLALAGVYWLLSFWSGFTLKARRTAFAFVVVSAVLFVSVVGLAYGQPTIVTWNMWQVPVALWANALAGGPLMALAARTAAGLPVARRTASACLALAVCAVGVATVVYALQGLDMQAMRNSIVRADELVPGFFAGVALYALLCLAGVVLQALALLRAGSPGSRRTLLAVCGCALALAGIFVMRFLFYMSHMTVGLSV